MNLNMHKGRKDISEMMHDALDKIMHPVCAQTGLPIRSPIYETCSIDVVLRINKDYASSESLRIHRGYVDEAIGKRMAQENRCGTITTDIESMQQEIFYRITKNTASSSLDMISEAKTETIYLDQNAAIEEFYNALKAFNDNHRLLWYEGLSKKSLASTALRSECANRFSQLKSNI